jgi:hypothetical protein
MRGGLTIYVSRSPDARPAILLPHGSEGTCCGIQQMFVERSARRTTIFFRLSPSTSRVPRSCAPDELPWHRVLGQLHADLVTVSDTRTVDQKKELFARIAHHLRRTRASGPRTCSSTSPKGEVAACFGFGGLHEAVDTFDEAVGDAAVEPR